MGHAIHRRRRLLLGTSSHGNLQMALGKEAVFELSSEAAQFMEADERGEELLDCVPFGDELVAVYARCHRRIKSTGERVSYEYVMVVRVEMARSPEVSTSASARSMTSIDAQGVCPPRRRC